MRHVLSGRWGRLADQSSRTALGGKCCWTLQRIAAAGCAASIPRRQWPATNLAQDVSVDCGMYGGHQEQCHKGRILQARLYTCLCRMRATAQSCAAAGSSLQPWRLAGPSRPATVLQILVHWGPSLLPSDCCMSGVPVFVTPHEDAVVLCCWVCAIAITMLSLQAVRSCAVL